MQQAQPEPAEAFWFSQAAQTLPVLSLEKSGQVHVKSSATNLNAIHESVRCQCHSHKHVQQYEQIQDCTSRTAGSQISKT
jgi:hypothetical protein